MRQRMTLQRPDRNGPCWCGSGNKYKHCHQPVEDRILAYQLRGYEVPTRKLLKTPADVEGIKKSAAINMAALDAVAEKIRAGMSTEEINTIVNDVTYGMGGIPADLNYQGYPKSVCTSVNEQVCHGIPAPDVILREGDIINVDCSTILDGYFSDSSRMFIIGQTTPEKEALVRIAKECMEEGLKQVIPWHTLGDMGSAVNRHAKENGCTIVREIGGHGCGNAFHEDPWVSYVSSPGTEMLMVPGMVFTIEPMVNLGKAAIREDKKNGWTIYTADGMPSAQWEIEVLVTETGHEVLCR